MNKIRAIQALNKKEIEQGIPTNASWHTDYRDTAYIYFGGLPYELSEGDVITIFSQFGEPVFLKLARDKESGKSKGFGWLKYEDQRSTDLAVDNLGGAEIGGRMISVDHAHYKARDDEDAEAFKVGWEDMKRREGQPVSEDESSEEERQQRPMLPEERELAILMRDHDDDDPMKAFLIEEKKKQVDGAKRKAEKQERKHKHRHHRSHRHRRRGSDEDRPGRSRRDESSDDGGGGGSRRHRGGEDSRDGERRRHHREDSKGFDRDGRTDREREMDRGRRRHDRRPRSRSRSPRYRED
ncbi:RNA-binding motif protein, X-linked 2 [Tolypocladium capitatum]|uniref:RNA-binding motif protein, X-linked 2 n=1 Tax=Tolypocladium capitatum TaxID=45235 RepID=A0A2K3Q7G5_9HYPO|nr:RNA-binding motif protein, X-linked 2 [Tolypocladium capitatum]